MPVIFHKNVMYAGGGGSSDLEAIELTQAEYDALPISEKEDLTKLYFLTDGEGGGGGGGGSSYSETVLFSQSYGAFPNVIALSDEYTNYDALIFYLYKADDSSYYDFFCNTFPKSFLDEVRAGAKSGRTNDIIMIAWHASSTSGNAQWCRYSVTNTTTLTKIASDGNWGIGKVVGVKY